MRKSLILLFCLLTAGLLNAQNPYLPLWEVIPDGEPYVFEDPDAPGKYRVYIYGSHDMLVNNYCGRDLVTWSAPIEDLSKWRYDGVIFELKKDANGKWLNKDHIGDVLYAPDVALKVLPDGTKEYYLYPNVQSDERSTAVAKSSRPNGPFEVINWDPEKPRETVGPFGFDPAAFVDDDGRVYGYWGYQLSNAGELDPNTMSTLKPGTNMVRNMIFGHTQDQTYKFFEASSIRKIKDKYVFVYSRITNEGEFGLPSTNYTLAYCWSNSPLGPWTYGGTIIDGRGKEKRPDGTTIPTATFHGNTHGSICYIPSESPKPGTPVSQWCKEVPGQWWVFYHRQADTTEYSRQAMVAPIEVEVIEGVDGFVRITEAEYTSEGFATQGLDPYKRYSAGIACYYTHPEKQVQNYPSIIYPGSHTKVYREQYALPAKEESTAKKSKKGKKVESTQTVTCQADPYDLQYNYCPIVNNTPGSAVGYKYFNFSSTYGKDNLKLSLGYKPESTEGTIDVYLDKPTESEGGVKIGSYKISATQDAINQHEKSTLSIPVQNLKYYNGKHALYLMFSAPTKGKSICELVDLGFE